MAISISRRPIRHRRRGSRSLVNDTGTSKPSDLNLFNIGQQKPDRKGNITSMVLCAFWIWRRNTTRGPGNAPGVMQRFWSTCSLILGLSLNQRGLRRHNATSYWLVLNSCSYRGQRLGLVSLQCSSHRTYIGLSFLPFLSVAMLSKVSVAVQYLIFDVNMVIKADNAR